MDPCFNRFIPKSRDDLIVIRPASKTFVNGMAEAYSFDDYNVKLMEWNMTSREYERMIEMLNEKIYNEYPCPGCQLFAYFCCLCTLGCSCLIPYAQVRGAMAAMRKEIDRLNE